METQALEEKEGKKIKKKKNTQKPLQTQIEEKSFMDLAQPSRHELEFRKMRVPFLSFVVNKVKTAPATVSLSRVCLF